MAILANTEQALMRQVGPLPLWGWAAIGGVGLVIYRVIRSGKSGATTLATGTGGAATSGTGASSGNGAGGGGSASPPITPSQLSVSDLATLAKSLGPNYNSLTYSANGQSLAVGNTSQNALDAANYQAQLQALSQTTQAQYAAEASDTAAAYGANTANTNALYGYLGAYQKNLLDYGTAQQNAYYNAALAQYAINRGQQPSYHV